MERECLKCGSVNGEAVGNATEACPSCGAIYAKVASIRAQQRLGPQQMPSHRGRLPIGRLVGGMVMVMLVVVAVMAYKQHAEKVRVETLLAQHAQQQAAQKEKMLHAMRENGTLGQWRDDWDMQLRIASATGRIALAGPVKDLAETAKKTRELHFDTPCVVRSRGLLANAMDIRVEEFLLFMQQRENDAAPGRADDAMSAFESYNVKCMRSMRPDLPQSEQDAA